MKYFGIAISVIIVGVIGFATVKKLSPVGWVAALRDGSLERSRENRAKRQLRPVDLKKRQGTRAVLIARSKKAPLLFSSGAEPREYGQRGLNLPYS